MQESGAGIVSHEQDDELEARLHGSRVPPHGSRDVEAWAIEDGVKDPHANAQHQKCVPVELPRVREGDIVENELQDGAKGRHVERIRAVQDPL